MDAKEAREYIVRLGQVGRHQLKNERGNISDNVFMDEIEEAAKVLVKDLAENGLHSLALSKEIAQGLGDLCTHVAHLKNSIGSLVNVIDARGA